jgi:hypothetical protein
VDLPEIEDLPTTVAALTGRGFEIKFTDASATKVRQLYMRHVHGVGFRLIGEVFARLPVCEERGRALTRVTPRSGCRTAIRST